MSGIGSWRMRRRNRWQSWKRFLSRRQVEGHRGRSSTSGQIQPVRRIESRRVFVPSWFRFQHVMTAESNSRRSVGSCGDVGGRFARRRRRSRATCIAGRISKMSLTSTSCTSAVVVGPIVDRDVRKLGVGPTVLEAVRATRRAVGTNTNLGTLLLLAPLAAVPDGVRIAKGIGDVLRRADVRRHATSCTKRSASRRPADLGERTRPMCSTSRRPTCARRRDAAGGDRDLVARQYCERLRRRVLAPPTWIEEGVARGWSLDDGDRPCSHSPTGQGGGQPDPSQVRSRRSPSKPAADAARVLDVGPAGRRCLRTRASKISISGSAPTVIGATRARRPTSSRRPVCTAARRAIKLRVMVRKRRRASRSNLSRPNRQGRARFQCGALHYVRRDVRAAARAQLPCRGRSRTARSMRTIS